MGISFIATVKNDSRRASERKKQSLSDLSNHPAAAPKSGCCVKWNEFSLQWSRGREEKTYGEKNAGVVCVCVYIFQCPVLSHQLLGVKPKTALPFFCSVCSRASRFWILRFFQMPPMLVCNLFFYPPEASLQMKSFTFNECIHITHSVVFQFSRFVCYTPNCIRFPPFYNRMVIWMVALFFPLLVSSQSLCQSAIVQTLNLFTLHHSFCQFLIESAEKVDSHHKTKWKAKWIRSEWSQNRFLSRARATKQKSKANRLSICIGPLFVSFRIVCVCLFALCLCMMKGNGIKRERCTETQKKCGHSTFIALIFFCRFHYALCLYLLHVCPWAWS